MIKFKNISIIKVAVFGVLFMTIAFFMLDYHSSQKEIKEIIIRGHTIHAEVSRTAETNTLGLSGREEICRSCGMLFLFPEKSRHSFWMKGMQFNLDIIWISDNRIVGIEKRVFHDDKKLSVLRPEVEVDRVLEVRAGLSDEWGIAMGDEVIF